MNLLQALAAASGEEDEDRSLERARSKEPPFDPDIAAALLRDYYVEYSKPRDFKVGDIVELKPGMLSSHKNHMAVAVVLAELPEPRWAHHGDNHTFAAERQDIMIGVVAGREKAFVIFAASSASYRKRQEIPS